MKAQPRAFPVIDVAYSFKEALSAPIVMSLPSNGLRLRFDGPDQRLRLIEVLDFSKIHLTYKSNELVKPSGAPASGPTAPDGIEPNGPSFRSVYTRLLGPTFPGEYFPPPAGQTQGTYILSYPGIAFSFLINHAAYSANADFVSTLSSSSTSPAKCLTMFNGSSWKDARSDLMTRPCPHPRSLAPASTQHGRDPHPDEVARAVVQGRGRIELHLHLPAPFTVVLGETTPQDLVAQLGPPDAIFYKYDRRLNIHRDRRASRTDPRPVLSSSPGQVGGMSDTDRSSAYTATDNESSEEDVRAMGNGPPSDHFYNYFRHGFDVFISYATAPSPPLDPSTASDGEPVPSFLPTSHLVATKILLHGNVPGSFAFQRHRRSRWLLDPAHLPSVDPPLTSETPFPTIQKQLKRVWSDAEVCGLAGSTFQKHMVLNRGYAESPSSSVELLGNWEDGSEVVGRDESEKEKETADQALANTELHGFPGLLFEVLKNGAVVCLTVY